VRIMSYINNGNWEKKMYSHDHGFKIGAEPLISSMEAQGHKPKKLRLLKSLLNLPKEEYTFCSNEKKVAKGLLLTRARGCKLKGLLDSDLKRGIVRVIPAQGGVYQ
jgi:hypothetical protein